MKARSTIRIEATDAPVAKERTRRRMVDGIDRNAIYPGEPQAVPDTHYYRERIRCGEARFVDTSPAVELEEAQPARMPSDVALAPEPSSRRKRKV